LRSEDGRQLSAYVGFDRRGVWLDRNRGMGAALIHDLMAECQAPRKRLQLQVAKGNRSCPPYERMGFLKTGEEEIYDHMGWNPAHWDCHFRFHHGTARQSDRPPAANGPVYICNAQIVISWIPPLPSTARDEFAANQSSARFSATRKTPLRERRNPRPERDFECFCPSRGGSWRATAGCRHAFSRARRGSTAPCLIQTDMAS